MFIRIIDETGDTLLKGEINKKTLAAIKRLVCLKISVAKAQDVIDLYNVICINLSPVKILNNDRKNAIASAMNDGIDFVELFKKSAESDYMNGKNKDGWKATFDWILKPRWRARILEGVYDNPKGQTDSSAPNFDVAELEASAYERYKKCKKDT